MSPIHTAPYPQGKARLEEKNDRSSFVRCFSMPRRDELDEEFDFQETVPENDITLLKTAYRNEIVLFD